MENDAQALTGRQRLKVFLPLAGFLIYVAYLALFSARPFLLKWLEGCFGLFVALVFCNILRRNTLAEAEHRDGGDADQH